MREQKNGEGQLRNGAISKTSILEKILFFRIFFFYIFHWQLQHPVNSSPFLFFSSRVLLPPERSRIMNAVEAIGMGESSAMGKRMDKNIERATCKHESIGPVVVIAARLFICLRQIVFNVSNDWKWYLFSHEIIIILLNWRRRQFT